MKYAKGLPNFAGKYFNNIRQKTVSATSYKFLLLICATTKIALLLYYREYFLGLLKK